MSNPVRGVPIWCTNKPSPNISAQIAQPVNPSPICKIVSYFRHQLLSSDICSFPDAVIHDMRKYPSIEVMQKLAYGIDETNMDVLPPLFRMHLCRGCARVITALLKLFGDQALGLNTELALELAREYQSKSTNAALVILCRKFLVARGNLFDYNKYKSMLQLRLA